MAFCFLLVFDYKISVESLGDKLRENSLTAEDLNWLNNNTLVTNEPGTREPRVK